MKDSIISFFLQIIDSMKSEVSVLITEAAMLSITNRKKSLSLK